MLDWAQGHLDKVAISRAIEILSNARPIEFFGFGASGIVASDAQQKFPLFGVPCGAQTDSHQQFMAAAMMNDQDAAVVISNTGQTRPIIEVARMAREAGAKVIGLIGSDSPLTSYCDITILIETLDNTNIYTPTTSRIAFLVIVDILSTGVALTKDNEHQKKVGRMKRRLSDIRTAQIV